MSMPPLKPLHPDCSLIVTKLEALRKVSTQDMIASLTPGHRDALRTRPDGTILNGHHRVKILKERGFDVDTLPREVIAKEMDNED